MNLPTGGWKMPLTVHHHAWFPGRIAGGAALVVAPVVWFAGLLLRHLGFATADFTAEQLTRFDQQPFAAMGQMAAYAGNPALVTAGYACFAVGAILLCPAVITLARIVAARSPKLAYLGGTLLVLGLFSRLYWAGVDQTAFQLIGRLGLEQATQVVLDTYVETSYGPWRVPVTAAFGLYIGTFLLAIGALRSGTFGVGRFVLFLWAGTLWTGVLKESSLLKGVVSSAVLPLVLVPLGVQVLRDVVPELRVERSAGRGRPWSETRGRAADAVPLGTSSAGGAATTTHSPPGTGVVDAFAEPHTCCSPIIRSMSSAVASEDPGSAEYTSMVWWPSGSSMVSPRSTTPHFPTSTRRRSPHGSSRAARLCGRRASTRCRA
ncbi:hypothetical protein AB0H88_46980 [Nonomuraea sp. NPDC050680]|uniref:hypothetical protein n=1 Tax=Nonomuraea sp. NPDC050680 TaxID=3154630 RepID=UPI0033EFF3A9